MDPKTEKTFKALQEIRTLEEIKFPVSGRLRTKINSFRGVEDLVHRKYQVVGVLHLMLMARFVLGDDCGLGKCVSTSTLTHTDQGLIPLGELSALGIENLTPGEFSQAKPVKVWTGRRWSTVSRFYYDGVKPSKKITTRQGYQIEGSLNHPVLVRDETETEVWKKTSEIRPGDFLCISRLKAPLDKDLVVSVEDSQCELVDIEVDDPDHCFVGNGIVNHNTIQSISALCSLWDKNPATKVIVVTNKSLVGQWGTEFAKFTQDGEIQVFLCYGDPKRRKKTYEQFKAFEGPCVLILGYASVRQDYFECLEDLRGFTLVLDECTNIKTPSARLSQICRLFSANAARCWGLTATLIKRDLRDGWGIYAVVYPGLFEERTESAFMSRFCLTREVDTYIGSGKTVKKTIIIGHSNAQVAEFSKVIEPYFLSRSKKIIEGELPALTIKLLELEMSSAQQIKYQEALNGLLTLDSGEEKETTKLSRLSYCQQIVNHLELIDCEGPSPKLDALLDLLTNGDLVDQKVVVFSRFRSMIDIIERELKAKNVKTVRLTGNEDVKQRKEAISTYDDPESGVNVCLMTEAAKEGANLQVTKALIFFDTPWTGGDFVQILGRMVRIGSLHPAVYAIHLVIRGSIDERTIEKLQSSMELIEDIVGQRVLTVDGGNELMIKRKGEIKDLFASLLQDRK